MDFSIIIPTYNRPERLSTCLRSLTLLEYPRDRFEVIVVDDGDTMPLEDSVALLREQLAVTVVRQAHAGPAIARNTGAAHARGRFLAFTDDDCAPACDWLRTLARRFARTSDHAVTGQTFNALPENLYATASQLLVSYLYVYFNTNPDQARFFTSNNLALPTEQFLTIGGFDPTFPVAGGEDREFCDRWLCHGYRIIYAQEVVVQHAHALTLRTFWRQHVRYGRGAFRFHQRRAQREQDRIRIEPWQFYQRLLRYPFSQEYRWRAFKCTLLLMLAQVANAYGFFWERRQ
jgi:glycosyltransferase involved in cell wall biosynthesis